MLFHALNFISIFLTVAFGAFCGETGLVNFAASLTLYAGLLFTSFLITIFVSLCLGDSDKYVLRKSSSENIISMTADLVTTESGFTLPVKALKATIFVEADIEPYLVTRTYNISNRRRRWLWEMYKDRVEYIAYLPKNWSED